MKPNAANNAASILLIEDNPGDAVLVREALSGSGLFQFAMAHVDRLDAGLAALAQDRFDAVLVDLSLPDASGLETVRQTIKAAGSIPVVVLTGLEDENTAIESLRAGAQDYLIKGERDDKNVIRSITYAIERNRSDEKLIQLAHYDELTGLANRALFRDRLATAMHRADRTDQLVGLLFVDLDGFKSINDKFGHLVGDRAIRIIAERIVGSVRKIDTVARLGGDEFAIVLETIFRPADVANLAQKLLRAVGQPLSLGGADVFVTASIGVATYPETAREPEGLLESADAAMYRVKARGGDGYHFPANLADAVARNEDQPERSLRVAIEQEQFLLYYQPRAETGSGRVTSVEALIRWKHPQKGIILPSQFIPLTEETGLIEPLGEWILATACGQLAEWIDQGLPEIVVAVNIAARQFRHEGQSARIARVLTRSGINPSLVEFELTEGTLVDSSTAAISIMEGLAGLGCQISVDDFGTGYSSIGYLTNFPISALKIDKSFVSNLDADSNNPAIVQAIIGLARSLRLKVIAEGVETEEQRSFLDALGCDEIQGFLVSPPLPAEDFPAWIKASGRPVGLAAAATWQFSRG